jgi:ubiquinone/menaquinone biosynthesis C-methylase UbiE
MLTKGWGFSNGVLSDLKNMQRIDQHSIWNESEFTGRAKVPYSTSWCENIFAQDLLGRMMGNLNLDADSPILDAGCGDGRFTHFFLENGFSRIIALDYELGPLLRLRQSLTDEESRKVLLVQATAATVPFQEESLAFVLAWGLLSSMPDFSNGLDHLVQMIQSGGLLINAEPVLEQHLIYSLVNGDLSEFKRTVTESTRPRDWIDKSRRYKIPSDGQLSQLMFHANLETSEYPGIPIWPSLIFGSSRLSETLSLKEKEEMWVAIQALPASYSRQRLFYSTVIRS